MQNSPKLSCPSRSLSANRIIFDTYESLIRSPRLANMYFSYSKPITPRPSSAKN